jgi:hypothetical protein
VVLKPDLGLPVVLEASEGVQEQDAAAKKLMRAKAELKRLRAEVSA